MNAGISGRRMNKETTQIVTEWDFVVFLGQIAERLHEDDLTHAKADLLECLDGMIEYLDNTDSELPRDGLKWAKIAAMIRIE